MSDLALNMIVAGGEAALLRRCLTSIPEKLIDEIVIVNTSEDMEIDGVVDDFGGKVIHTDWATEEYPHGNFSRARNVALDNTKSHWVMWLDADDVLEFSEDSEEPVDIETKVLNLRLILDKQAEKNDGFFLRYVLTTEDDGTPQTAFYRDRIFKRCAKFRWRRPVHEILTRNWDNLVHDRINGLDVVHLPNKTKYGSADRNVKILEAEYAKGKRDEHTMFFLSRDYMIIGNVKKAESMVKEMIREMSANPVQLYMSCFHMACWYMYEGFEVRPEIDKIKLEYQQTIEGWLRMAIEFCNAYAEPYVLLGDLYYRKGNFAGAERLYKQALEKKLVPYGVHCTPYYEELPALRLSWMYTQRKDFEQALFYNRRALIHNKGNEEMLAQRTYILKKLREEMNKT